MKKLQMAILCTIMILFFSCKKDIPLQEQSSSVKVDYLPGPCPYDCHDSRCQGYLNGYCGPGATTPNQLPVAQAIALVGQVHNDGLSYLFNNINLTFVDGYTNANRVMTGVLNFYSAYEGGMTTNYRTEFINLTADFYNRKSYFNAADGHTIDSAIQSQFNLISPSRSGSEIAVINNARNIFHFNTSGMTFGQICDNVTSRANIVLTQYNGISWPSGGGGFIGGYIQIVLKSAAFWKYCNDNGTVPPMSARGEALMALSRSDGGARSFLQLPPFLRFLAALNPIQADAAGYLWGWGKSYFGGERSESKRIYDGATEALHGSSLGLLK